MKISEIPALPESFKNTGLITFNKDDTGHRYVINSATDSIQLLLGEYEIDTIDREIYIDREVSNVTITLAENIDNFAIKTINTNMKAKPNSLVIKNGIWTTPNITVTLSQPVKNESKSNETIQSKNQGSSSKSVNLKNF